MCTWDMVAGKTLSAREKNEQATHTRSVLSLSMFWYLYHFLPHPYYVFHSILFFFLSLSCIIWYFSFTSFFCNFCKVSTLCFLFFVSLQILNSFISGLTLDSCSCDCYNKVEILQPSVGFSWNYTAADNLILFCITYADKAGKTTKSQYGIR